MTNMAPTLWMPLSLEQLYIDRGVTRGRGTGGSEGQDLEKEEGKRGRERERERNRKKDYQMALLVALLEDTARPAQPDRHPLAAGLRYSLAS